MSEDVVERVARVVARKRIGSKVEVPPMVVGTWDRNTALAVIEALRETPASITKINGSANWPQMIDAILKARSSSVTPL